MTADQQENPGRPEHTAITPTASGADAAELVAPHVARAQLQVRR